MGSVVQIRGPVDARPQLRHHLRRDKIVVGRRKLVFELVVVMGLALRRPRSLAERDGRGGEHGRKQLLLTLCFS